jgi:hypothetical protein
MANGKGCTGFLNPSAVVYSITRGFIHILLLEILRAVTVFRSRSPVLPSYIIIIIRLVRGLGLGIRALAE